MTVVQAGTALGRLPVWRLLARRDFGRLLATRLTSQFGDGVFQAALAGTVLFNPERAADPLDVAAGFAVATLLHRSRESDMTDMATDLSE